MAQKHETTGWGTKRCTMLVCRGAEGAERSEEHCTANCMPQRSSARDDKGKRQRREASRKGQIRGLTRQVRCIVLGDKEHRDNAQGVH